MASALTGSQRILIVDNVLANLAMLEALLAQENVAIIQTDSGKKALEILSNTAVSLVILDVLMPEMDGCQVAELIHSNPKTQSIPIIFMTGVDNHEPNLFKGIQSGAVDVLYKPLQPEIIRSKVKVFLELDQQRQLIKHYAQHDRLTGLFNREQITNILVRLMANARRSKKLLGLLFLDLDHFKSINDTFGHDAGDLLLKSVADRVRGAVREGDFVARLGGDEFAVILSELDSSESAGLVAQKILDQMVMPHALTDHEILISSSIGIALYDNQDKLASDLLKSADSAMYQAKKKGRSQFAYFSPDLEQKALKRMEIARDLNHTIDNNELSVFYQPQISASNGEVVGFEALMRWQKNQEWISPALFIPIAEETGLIPKLGEWILNASCKQLKRWQDQNLLGRIVKVSVNVSSRQIQSKNFLTVLKNALESSGLAPACLELELTESTVMDDPETTISVFKAIHQLGVEIAVDDFGTGYSSLAYLRHLPLDRLKIDQSFVRDIDIDRNDEAIVKAIIGLSHNLGLNVVAEGVETEEQSAFLRRHHCDTLQGYLFARPLPAVDIPDFLRKQTRGRPGPA